MRYRMLKPGEIIKKGDELRFKSDLNGPWHPCRDSVGICVLETSTHNFRRPISTPKKNMKNTVKAPKRPKAKPLVIKESVHFSSILKMTQKAINEACRERGIPIGKYKSTTAFRLYQHFSDTNAKATVTIQ